MHDSTNAKDKVWFRLLRQLPAGGLPTLFFWFWASYLGLLGWAGSLVANWVVGPPEANLTARHSPVRATLLYASTANASIDNRPPYFSIGASEDEVRSAQGEPDRVSQNAWLYKNSRVDFENGRVAAYRNGGELYAAWPIPMPKVLTEGAVAYFTEGPSFAPIRRGASPEEVLASIGPPSAVTRGQWFYRSGVISFRKGLVASVSRKPPALQLAHVEGARRRQDRPEGPLKKGAEYIFLPTEA